MLKPASFHELEAWRLAMDLAEACFIASTRFPKTEVFGLTSQLRRAALSVPSNLAEGHRRPRPAYLNHVSIALGSHAEVETCLELAKRLGWVEPDEASKLSTLASRVGQVLHGLVRSLRR